MNRTRLGTAVLAGTLAAGVVAVMPAPAGAQGYIGYGPWPPYPLPGFYPPPAPYDPPPAPHYPPPPGPDAAAPPAAASAITYTKRPAFKNLDGDTCREYRTTVTGRTVYGTACRDARGQWRIVN
jgi:hypothetical protein